MENFLNQYVTNLIQALDNHEISFADLNLKCKYCPFAERCGDAADKGDNRTCERFIRDTIAEE